ncbi:hypothetical protein CONLIGDRAFT_646123 [Coniochaeta ligniaria NRRL 30616]|uniref:CBM1 domain-containing protein n=1 Tax=Coniochaeta ligniaria NRRL 30616 TaxID=1408157 RepID=A0A1J7JF78_9PEZI|nr:hypothetical protein CONLIGDRAFT_646123 [Coniochaeta ligniaria NRRL 30616]
MKVVILIYLSFAALAAASLIPSNYVCEWTRTGWNCYYKARTTTITSTVGGKPTTITKTITPTTSVYTTTSCYPTLEVTELPMSLTWTKTCGLQYFGFGCNYAGITITTTINDTPTLLVTTVYPSYSSYTTTTCTPTIVTTIIK